jgi:predicted metal-binding protein
MFARIKPWFQVPDEHAQTELLLKTLKNNMDAYEDCINKANNDTRNIEIELQQLKEKIKRKHNNPSNAEKHRVQYLSSLQDDADRQLNIHYNNLHATTAKYNNIKNHSSTHRIIDTDRMINEQHSKVLQRYTPNMVAETLAQSAQQNKQMETVRSVLDIHHSDHSSVTNSVQRRVNAFFEQIDSELNLEMPNVGRVRLDTTLEAPQPYGHSPVTVSLNDKTDIEPLLPKYDWTSEHS